MTLEDNTNKAIAIEPRIQQESMNYDSPIREDYSKNNSNSPESSTKFNEPTDHLNLNYTESEFTDKITSNVFKQLAPILSKIQKNDSPPLPPRVTTPEQRYAYLNPMPQQQPQNLQQQLPTLSGYIVKNLPITPTNYRRRQDGLIEPKTPIGYMRASKPKNKVPSNASTSKEQPVKSIDSHHHDSSIDPAIQEREAYRTLKSV